MTHRLSCASASLKKRQICRSIPDVQLHIVDAPVGAGPESILPMVVMDCGFARLEDAEVMGRRGNTSCPGLTRASIHLQKSVAKMMDCRVKPGNDERVEVLEAQVRHQIAALVLDRVGASQPLKRRMFGNILPIQPIVNSDLIPCCEKCLRRNGYCTVSSRMPKTMMTLRTTLFCIVGTLGILVGFSGGGPRPNDSLRSSIANLNFAGGGAFDFLISTRSIGPAIPRKKYVQTQFN
jgi:hypothetical protein